MKTITITKNIFAFDELTPEQQAKAIELIRESYNEFNEFAQQAIDNDYLFEPKNDELLKMFGASFYETLNERYKYKDRPLIGNTRKHIYFSIERDWSIEAADGIEVNHDLFFKAWLGIPSELAQKVSYLIQTTKSRNPDTYISFTHDFREFNKSELEIIETAEAKFKQHMDTVLKFIQQSIEYYYSDAAIREDIQANDIEFEVTPDGTVLRFS